jgi:hypothetical protein
MKAAPSPAIARSPEKKKTDIALIKYIVKDIGKRTSSLL